MDLHYVVTTMQKGFMDTYHNMAKLVAQVELADEPGREDLKYSYSRSCSPPSRCLCVTGGCPGGPAGSLLCPVHLSDAWGCLRQPNPKSTSTFTL